jgi:hypothetical protein
MGVKLPFRKFTVFSVLAVFVAGFTISSVQAQVAITDSNRFDVAFTKGETVKGEQSIVLSLEDLHLLVGEEYTDPLKSWDERTNNGYFLEYDSGTLAVNGLRASTQDAGTYASLIFVNDSGKDFDALEIAFDFLYRSETSLNGELKLHYRVNRNKWKEVTGTVVSLASMQRSSNTWSSFSIQSHIDEFYLRNGDTIEFAWIPDQLAAEMSGQLPIALQQVEIIPNTASIQPPARGSLIITEILTSDPESRSPEFIELYNPSGVPVSLKGMVLSTATGNIVVQNNVSVKPYSFFVLASAGDGENIPFRYDYRYNVKLLSPGSGYAELRFGNTETAKATYDMAEAGVAHELDRVSNAFDGYTSMQYLTASPFEIESNLRGTPGRRGITTRMFTHRIDHPGWHVVTLPGEHNSRLNRNSSLTYRDLSGNEMVPENAERRQPMMVFAGQESVSSSIVVDENGRASENFQRIDSGDRAGFSLLTLPGYNALRLGSMANEMNLPVTPAVQVWDVREQAFRVKFGRETLLSPWNPVIVNREVQTPVNVVDESRISSAADLERYIRITLSEEQSNRREAIKDEVILGFIDRRLLRTDRRFDLPKLYPLLNRDQVQQDITLLHASNSLSRQRTNSFTHLPHELDNTYQVGLGITTSKGVIQGVLDWSAMEDIPDEWVLTLEDRVTGNSIDMREQTTYRFRYTSSGEMKREEIAENPFTQVTPLQDERFVITMKPYRAALETTSDNVRPGTVELRQNYPNPFNPATNIVYYLPEETQVRIGIWNVVGQQVALLVDDTMRAGENSVTWNASDMPSGIYIVQLETGNRIFTRKITLIK